MIFAYTNYGPIFFYPWMICVLVAAAIGYMRNRVPESAALGLLLGPLGVIVAALLPTRYPRRCPSCRFGIPGDASKCGHCGADV